MNTFSYIIVRSLTNIHLTLNACDMQMQCDV